ncbi:MFS transporter [Sulfitobacter sp. M57]|uniref:MFS transporter n=1 Tax=unclassified Sulfitobacter TaxID=196795 RepID=UPI0023E32BD2|nr:MULTISPECIES: MFS transporter [unclassified Sulfitobacter]MDF3413939.1 MFS transporter [Sulfitobacter sp. KE5]MDF3420780.1 MFS transporter [Sulfitobacter sp. KE43]MDF3432485.1 MFS transporter [Sulfitobacter sp. KE42]MDF3458124.1 MFS transporter [Sulfitobacter sp. S74]MDF3462025.1 MFS transporter [Sulfitobacter sp. Ks18]
MIDDTRAKRNVAVLVAAQAFLGSQITMIFVIGGLAGQQLSPNVCLATLPISMIVFGSMTTAPWLSPLMQKHGRRAGFLVGALGGLVGAIVCAFALSINNFWVFLIGSYLTGIYMSSQGFFRFAATDTASETFRPKAISYVMAGGLISAIIGPQLVSVLSAGGDATVMRFFPVYLAAMALNVIGMGLFFLLDIPKPVPPTLDSPKGRTRLELLTTPRIAVAVICGMVAYALMNLVMTSTPLAVVGCGFGVADASNIVTGHVLAMFAPSFFTGHLINRFGVEKIVGLGMAILAVAGVVALQGVALSNFYIALILLGLGWNFGFIGATTMLAGAHEPHERGQMQGLNDLLVFGGVTFASLASGGLMNCSGGDAATGWAAVNMAMIPFLALAGGSLIWLVMRPKEA